MRAETTPPPVPASALWPEFTRCRTAGLDLRAEAGNDLPFLEALYASTRADEVNQVPGWDRQQKMLFLSQQFAAQTAHYAKHYPEAVRAIILHGTVAIGRLYLADWDRQTRIVDIALMAHMRNRGFGSAILADILDRAAEMKNRVSIHVEKFNPARNLYLRLGFHAIEDKGVYDLMEWSGDTPKKN